MPYTLKADWTGYRVQAVAGVLAAYPRLTAQLRLYADPERLGEVSTIKLDWTVTQRNAAVRVLEEWLSMSDRRCLDARDGHGDYAALVQQQAQVHAALRDIRLYVAAERKARA
jgi:hypothetical protein